MQTAMDMLHQLNQCVEKLQLLDATATSTPIFITGIGSEVCFFQPDSALMSTLAAPGLPFDLRPGELYRLRRTQISQYGEREMDLILNRKGFGRADYVNYCLPLMLLASRVRDYEQNSAVVANLYPLTLVTSMREPYLKELKLRAESGEQFTVRVDGKKGESRACTVFCTPITTTPSSLKVGSRLELSLKSDRVPVVSRVLSRYLENGCSGVNWDLIDILYGERRSRVHSSPDLSLVPTNNATRNLNPEQREAVARHLSDGGSPINAVESPPGSGKTSLAVAMVRSFEGPGTQLVLSTANEPMYNFAEKLWKVGKGDKRVVHLISPTREVSKPTPFSVMLDENGVASHRFTELREKFTSANRKVKRQLKCQAGRLRVYTVKRMTETPNVVVATVDYILGLMDAPGSEVFKRALGDVRRIIVDESSQLTESALNALILRFGNNPNGFKTTLIGDSKQLPPFKYTKGDLISELGARSALDCARASGNVPITRFRRVYRGGPILIRHLQPFYPDVILISMKPESEINPVQCITKDWNSRCVLFKIDGQTKMSGTSKANDNELKALIRIVAQLERNGHAKEEVMIISYYDAQRQAVERALPGYGVHTVDSAQGRENAIVIVLTTRDSVPVEAGFLTCPYRCNVALSRAQEALIVLAHPSLLTAEPFSTVLSKEYFTHVEY